MKDLDLGAIFTDADRRVSALKTRKIPTTVPRSSEAARRQTMQCDACWMGVPGKDYDYERRLCRKCADAMDGKEPEEPRRARSWLGRLVARIFGRAG